MAMVTITNGEITTRVPAAAYETQYKRTGFRLVSDVEDTVEVKEEERIEAEVEEEETTEEQEQEDEVDDTEEEEEEEDVEDAEDAAFVEEILEKPLSQWTKDELKEFVRIKDIDTTGANKASEVRSIVKKFLEDKEKKSVES